MEARIKYTKSADGTNIAFWDSIGRQSPIVYECNKRAKEDGLKAALEWRDSKFADGRAALGLTQTKGAE